MFTEPSAAKQLGLTVWNETICNGSAFLTSTDLVTLHPTESVTVTVYVDAVNPVIVVPVEPLLQRYVNGADPVNPVICNLPVAPKQLVSLTIKKP